MAAISDSACRYVGVDLHKQTITIAAVEGTRKLISRKRFSNLQTDAIIAYLKSFMPFELVVEATASYEWFVQLVEPHARRVVLAHPGKLRVIAESTRKSDNLDAKLLAGLWNNKRLRRRRLPFNPSPDFDSHSRPHKGGRPSLGGID